MKASIEQTQVIELSIDVPAWIDQDITTTVVESICQGGCESGAYMPAVTYHIANGIMGEHGDAVLEYIEDVMGELPSVTGESWSGIAVKFLSYAVELWASGALNEIEELGEAVS